MSLLVVALFGCGHSQMSASVPASPPVHCLTFHYDNARLGWNSHETQLMPATVNAKNFGKLWNQELDGSVPGSPLVVSNLALGTQQRDVVFAATERNSVYALEAATGNLLWVRRELAPPLSDAEFTGGWGASVHGVLSTPVIDAATHTLYVCGLTRRGLRQHHLVWALDLATGKTKSGWPQIVRGVYRGKTGTKDFITGEVMQRGALSLVGNWLLVPFGGRGDAPPWRGWVAAFDTRRPQATPQLFCTCPFADGAGIWSAGGLSATASGDIFGVTGNGEYDLPRGGDHLGQSVFHLRSTASGLRFTRTRADYFTPANYQHLNDEDEDLGGASALVLPDMPGAKTPHLLFTGGKDGLGYLLNRDHLGSVGGQLQKLRLFGDDKAVYNEGIRATAAYFDAGDKGRLIFVAGDQPGPQEHKGMVALRLRRDAATGKVHFDPVWTLKEVLERPTTPVVSSQGNHNGIVWTVETEGQQKLGAALRAYDAVSGLPLYNSDSSGLADHLDYASRFVSPTVVNGRVFVSGNGITCYGLLPAASVQK